MHPREEHAPLKVDTDLGAVGFWPDVSEEHRSLVSFYSTWTGVLWADRKRIPEELDFRFHQSVFLIAHLNYFHFDTVVLRHMIETVFTHRKRFAPLCFQALGDVCVALFGEQSRPKKLDTILIELLDFTLESPNGHHPHDPPRTMKLKIQFNEGDHETIGPTYWGAYKFEGYFEVERTASGHEIRFLNAAVTP